MKKITLTLLLALTIQLVWTQCNELYISEIFYGEVDESDNFKNFSIEIFNPKGVSVNLSDYSFKFTAVGKTDHFINLTGTLADKGKFVVTLATSETTLANLSDFISGSFDYYNYEMLYFEKNGVVIDRFGKDNVTTANYDNFDIATFLTDPLYLATLNLNLQSLEDIDLRRHPLKTSGDVAWNGLVDNWYPYTTANFNNIGEHQGVCSGAVVVGWNNTTKTVNENAGTVYGEVLLTGSTDYLDVTLDLEYQENGLQESTGDYTRPSFYNSTGLEYDYNVSTEYKAEIATIVDDTEWEPYDESVLVVMYDVSYFNNPTTINPSKKNLLLVVTPSDETTGISNEELKKQVNIYPIVFKNIINIEHNIDIEIKNIKLYNNIGKKIPVELNNSKIIIPNLPSAYYFLLINTSKGSVSYKILKK